MEMAQIPTTETKKPTRSFTTTKMMFRVKYEGGETSTKSSIRPAHGPREGARNLPIAFEALLQISRKVEASFPPALRHRGRPVAVHLGALALLPEAGTRAVLRVAWHITENDNMQSKPIKGKGVLAIHRRRSGMCDEMLI